MARRSNWMARALLAASVATCLMSPALADGPFPGIEAFDPPPLAELDAQAEWEPMPVVDPMAALREQQTKEKPLATLADALRLQNTSAQNNAKILSAFGKLPKSESEADLNATITRHLRGDIRSSNPIMQNSVQEFDIIGLAGLGLFGFDWNMRPHALAETVVSWETSKDKLYDKLVIRDDITWSDGRPFTAHDVVFSFRTIMDPDVPVPAARTGTDELRWVEAYDDHTIVYFHKQALPTNVWNVNFPLIPKHVYEESLKEDKTLQTSPYHVELESNPVYGGPYTITNRVRGQDIVLTRRESWYMHNGKQVRDIPYFKEVRFRIIENQNTAMLALKGGEIEDLELNPEQWMTQTTDNAYYARNTKAFAPEWLYFYFGWNNKRPYFSDKRVRRAMSYAFDHEELLETHYYGLYQPCTGIFHPSAWMAPKKSPAPYTQDLDKAEELLAEAGWEDTDDDGILDKVINGKRVKFEFTVLCSNIPERTAICELLQQSLEPIGITCHVRPLEMTVLQQTEMEHNFDAYYGGWGTGTDPDLTDNIFGTQAAVDGRNFVQYSNAKVDELFLAGRKEFDREKRAAIYARIHQIIYDDQPYTFLFYRSAFYGFNKEVRGYRFSPRGPYHYNPGISSIWKSVD